MDSVATFFRLARALAEQLVRIHRRGIVHGDLWPPNIIISKNGDPVFIDFGESRIRKEISRANPNQGSHPWLAPEERLSVEGDVFSLCGTLFTLATGEPPPGSPKDIDELKRNVQRKLVRRSPNLLAGNWGVADIIARGLRHLDRRTADAEHLLADIELFDPRVPQAGPSLQADLRALVRMVPRLARKDPLFARMIGRQVRQLRSHVEEMLLDGIYEVRGDHNEIVMMVSEFLSAFDAGDLYLSVSIPALWRPENFGLRGRFWAMNREVTRRGVTVRRVFLLSDDEQRKELTTQVLSAQAEMLRGIEREEEGRPVNTREKDLAKEGIYVGVVVVSAKRKRQLLEDDAHGGMWLRGQRCKIATPYYDERRRRLRAVHLHPADATATAVRKAFVRDYLEPSQEVCDYLQALRS